VATPNCSKIGSKLRFSAIPRFGWFARHATGIPCFKLASSDRVIAPPGGLKGAGVAEKVLLETGQIDTRANAAMSLGYGRRGSCPAGAVTGVVPGSGVWFGLLTLSESRNARITGFTQSGRVRKVRCDVPGRMNSSALGKER